MFWIEKTVPFKYRKAIYDGIYEWNKAFEKAGFVNAIVVRAAAGQGRHGIRKTSATTCSAGSPSQRRLRDGPQSA